MPAISIYLTKEIYKRLMNSPDGESKTIQKALDRYLPTPQPHKPQDSEEQ